MDIENYWGKVEIIDIISPKEVLTKQGEFLGKMTDEIVFGRVEDLDFIELSDLGIDEDNSTFSYKFVIKSKFLPNYKYTMMAISHDITLYPLKMSLDSQIKEELNVKQKLLIMNSEEEFLNNLKRILQSSRVKHVISALIKLSK